MILINPFVADVAAADVPVVAPAEVTGACRPLYAGNNMYIAAAASGWGQFLYDVRTDVRVLDYVVLWQAQ